MLLLVLYLCSLLIRFAPLAPPSSVEISGSSRIRYTNRLSLTCNASGIVDNYKWYHNRDKLPTNTSRYYKSYAQLNDSGSYRCKACNWAGCTKSSSYTVTVIGWFTRIENHVNNNIIVHITPTCIPA